LPPSREKRNKGTVIWFNSQKGYGFIKPEDPTVNGGKDLFVHFHYLVQRGFKTLKQHDIVEFTVGNNKGGPCASDVKVLQRAEESTEEATP
jgi:CspA family cold shock protein